MSLLSNIGKGLAGGGALAFKGVRKGIKSFLQGTPEKRENVSTLRPEQEQLYQQAVNAGVDKGAGGAFGDAADYYRGLISGEGEDFNQFAAPQLRQYNEDIVPGLSEQFAGMGAGGLSSSGFRNAQVQGATDLSERLGAIRANLRQAGAQGLQGIGQQGLQNYSQNMVTQQGSPGFLQQAIPAALSAAGAYFTGPPGAAAGNAAGNIASNWFSSGNSGGNVGANRSPYQGGGGTSSAIPGSRLYPTFFKGKYGSIHQKR